MFSDPGTFVLQCAGKVPAYKDSKPVCSREVSAKYLWDVEIKGLRRAVNYWLITNV